MTELSFTQMIGGLDSRVNHKSPRSKKNLIFALVLPPVLGLTVKKTQQYFRGRETLWVI